MHDKIISEVSSLLNSPRSTDDISSALVDALGFDALDLISEVLSSRADVGQGLTQVVSQIRALRTQYLTQQVASNARNAEQHARSNKREKARADDDLEGEL